VPNFLGGTYSWDADWVPAKVKTSKNGVPSKQPTQRELHKAAATQQPLPAPAKKKSLFGTSLK